MSGSIHYKFADIDGASVAFCNLEASYYPKKNTASRNKLNPLSDGASFGEGFCSECDKKLKDLKLIKE